MRPCAPLLTLASLLLVVCPAAPVAAQTGVGSVSGRVVGADAGAPLSGAEVTLEARRTSAFSAADPATSPPTPPRRTVTTDSTGTYAFAQVASGTYSIRVDRIGYRSATLEIVLGDGAGLGVSVTLAVSPIELTPVLVVAGAPLQAPLSQLALPPSGRVSIEQYRAGRHLASDTRMVSTHDLVESATMVETDLFRTMQRLPGVSSRDDWTAELWTRGAAWGETRVYFDGVPLFNPVHGFGLFSGFSYQSVGTTVFHPGVRMPAQTESAAAVVELTSRSGVEVDGLEGGVDLSLGSVHGWARRPLQEGAGGLSLTARRSYVDALAAAFADEDESFPFSFSDVSGRLDLLTPVGRVEVSGLWETDEMYGELPDLVQGTQASWGNLAGRASLHIRPFGIPGTVSLGGTAYGAAVREIESLADSNFSAPHEPPADHSVRYGSVSVRVGGEDRRWRGGVDLTRQTVSYAGPQPLPYSDRSVDLDLPDVATDDVLTRGGAWGALRLGTGVLDVDVGVRLGVGASVLGSPADVQPTAIARVRASPSTTFFLGGGRYLQYTQSPATVGPRIARALQTGRYWALAGSEVPALDTRVFSIGGERWLSDAWLASVTGFERRSTGNLLPDPRPGFLIQRSPWVTGRVRARGVDVSLRRLVGRVTGALGYSVGRATATAVGVAFPAPTDRAHTIDVTGAIRTGAGSSLQLAYTFATGFPFVRTTTECLDDECFESRVFLDAPYQRRGPDYSSLDLVYSSSHGVGGARLTWYVQLRNVLNHDNAVSYSETYDYCPSGVYDASGCGGGAALERVDRFVDGMPLAPAIGLRVTF